MVKTTHFARPERVVPSPSERYPRFRPDDVEIDPDMAEDGSDIRGGMPAKGRSRQ
jgi:hypothetical protein